MSWDRSRSTVRERRPQRHDRRVDQSAPELAAEREKEGGSERLQEGLELWSFRSAVGPRKAGLRGEPGPGGADHTTPDRLAPTAKGAPGHRRVVAARLPGPVVGCLDTVSEDVDAGFEDRGQGETAPPKLRRRKRRGPARAEAHPEDRDLPRDLSGRKVDNAFAFASGVSPDAARVPAPGTADARLRGEGGQVVLPGFDRGDVLRKG